MIKGQSTDLPLAEVLRVAREVAQASDCSRLQVGAVVLDEYGAIISTGYNGAANKDLPCNVVNPAGLSDLCFCIHAEQRAIVTIPSDETPKTIYVTAFPCPSCLKLITSRGIQKVMYGDAYRYADAQGLTLARALGLDIIQVSMD